MGLFWGRQDNKSRGSQQYVFMKAMRSIMRKFLKSRQENFQKLTISLNSQIINNSYISYTLDRITNQNTYYHPKNHQHVNIYIKSWIRHAALCWTTSDSVALNLGSKSNRHQVQQFNQLSLRPNLRLLWTELGFVENLAEYSRHKCCTCLCSCCCFLCPLFRHIMEAQASPWYSVYEGNRQPASHHTWFWIFQGNRSCYSN